MTDDLLLQAAVDGELDAAAMVAFEARMAADPKLAAEYARLVALREAIRARAPRPKAPDPLRARVLAMAAIEAPKPGKRSAWRITPQYGALAASLALGVALGAGAIGLFAPPGEDSLERAAVAGYVRGRLVAQPVDVVSSDRHTLKPWFAGKLAAATTVLDLKADGFALIGGRIDVVGATPIATLIYQRREHQIALSELPGEGGKSTAPNDSTRDGYALLEWTDRGRRYVAVSDLPPTELDAFGAAFRRAAEAEREEPAKR
jgi:anti-sigma factor RsiW